MYKYIFANIASAGDKVEAIFQEFAENKSLDTIFLVSLVNEIIDICRHQINVVYNEMNMGN